MDFFTRIAEHTPQLNKNDNELLSYCIRNHTEIANLKVTELADRLFISPASVVRFCKKLGFSGYSDFKASLRMDLFEPEETPRKSHPTDFFPGYPQNHRDGSGGDRRAYRRADPLQPPH